MTAAVYSRHTGRETLAMLNELADLYDEVQSELPEGGHPLFSRKQFLSRTTSQAPKPGFELVTAHTEGKLAGYSFGFPFASGQWWAEATEPPTAILRARKFAVIELDVRRVYRGKGWGRELLDILLGSRQEEFATLATVAGSSAQAMYRRWGWHEVGAFTGEGPAMDAMMVALKPKA